MQPKNFHLLGVAVLLVWLAPWPAHAQGAPAGGGLNDAMAMPGSPGAGMFGGSPAGAKKITDGALSCEQIYAEIEILQKALTEQQALAAAAQKEADATRNAMMEQATGPSSLQQGSSIATGLLGMIPGVGMVAGLVGSATAQASASARMSGMQDSTHKMMQSQQKAIDLYQSMAYAQGRHEHLVDLFLKKDCKPPQK